MPRVLTAIGTRPEAIKLAPVVHALEAAPDFTSVVVLSGQHDELIRPVLSQFDITPDADLALMATCADLPSLTGGIVEGMTRAIEAHRPDVVVVQGDTVTAFGAALAAFYGRVPVAHVEAGLRTADRYEPFPEEVFRRLIDQVADVYFAPTEANRTALLREHVADDRIVVTGNTVVDALQAIARAERPSGLPEKRPGLRRLLLTAHRRENHGAPLRDVFGAVRALVLDRGDVDVVYPVHLNPNVRGVAAEMLGGLPNVHLLPPADYLSFVHLMHDADVILTDSGGVQEEAPSFGRPVLILRNKTERMELVEAGGGVLVGTDGARIGREVRRLLDDPDHYQRMSRIENPFGDGKAAARIVRTLRQRYQPTSHDLHDSLDTPPRAGSRSAA